MRHLARVLSLAAAALAASCAPDFEGKIGCASDLDCQTGSHCVDGKCKAGNSPPRIQWKEPAASAFLAGTVTFKVTADDPEGVAKVVLSNGSTVLKTFTAPDASFGKAGPADVTFSVDTSGFADGALTLTAEGTDGLGLAGGGAPRAFGVANAPAPAGAITATPSPAKKDTVVTITFTTTQELQGAAVTVAGNAATFASKSGLTQTFTYTVKGTEPEGANVVSVTTTNLAGVTDTKTGSVTFIFTPPGAPTLTASAPASPGNSLTPKILGTTAAGTVTVALYTAAGCSSTVAATGTAAAFAAPGLAVTVPAQVAGQAAPSTTFFGKATDAAGNVSACSTSSVTYVSKTVAPPAPTFSGSLPASPSNSTATTIKLLGSAEAGSTVQLFANANCTAPAAGGGSAAAFAAPGLDVPVAPADGTTVFTARATDAATNVSTCSATFSYVRNTALPSPPTFTATTPGSPFKSAGSTPVAVSVKGTVPPPPGGLAAAGVTLYSTSNCLPASLVVTGTVAAFTGAGLQVQVPKNTARTFWGTVTDVAGNVSGCSPSSITFIEDSAEATPTISSSQPASPSNLPGSGLFVTLTGTAPSGPSVAPSTVFFYVNDPSCTSAAVASGSAASFTTTGLSVPLLPNASTNYTARSQDTLGNSSGCSGPFNFVSDQGDAQPVFAAPSPASPSDTSTTFVLKGSADLGPTLSMVQLYSDAACTASVPATLTTAADFAATGIQVTVNPNGGGTFYAQSSDGAGNLSPCSAGVTLINDTQESKVVFGAPTPPSPSRTDTQFAVTGLADSGPFVAPGTVQLYVDASCSTGIVNASSTADAFVASGISVSVPSNGSLTVYAQSTDSLGHVSVCSDGLTLVNDTSEPNWTFTGANPLVQGGAATTFQLKGTPSGALVSASTVALWASSSCSGTPVASGPAGDFTGAGLAVGIPANTTSTLYANSTDAAGNTSPGCSAGLTVIHDNSEMAPVFTGVTEVTPSATSTSFHVKGTGTWGPAPTLIRLCTDAACTTPLAGSASSTPAAFASPGITVTLAANSGVSVWARATDAAGNTACSAVSSTLVNDSTESLSAVTSTPASPNGTASTIFTVKGTAPSGPFVAPSRVYYYLGDPTCAGTTGSFVSGAGFATTGISINVGSNNGIVAYFKSIDSLGNMSACLGLPLINDTQEAAPVFSGANPQVSTTSTFAVKGTAGFTWPQSTTSTVSLYTDGGCATSAGVAPITGAAFASTGFSVALAGGNQSKTFWANSWDRLNATSTCAATGMTLTWDNQEPAPAITTSTPASPSVAASGNVLLKGTSSALQLTGSTTTIHLYKNDPTCNNRTPGAGASFLVSGSLATFTSTGFSVPMVTNATTLYYALGADTAGNISTCSAPFAFTNAQFCASGVVGAEVFNANMHGCGGKVAFASRATLCGASAHVCSADEWVDNHGSSTPAFRYWTDDALRYSTFATDSCGAGGCDNGRCFVSNNVATTTACANPFQVATVANDPLGNGGGGGWFGCGFNSANPNHYFSGCGGATGATLCCAGATRDWFVDAVAGLDSNPGTLAAPFKTITKAAGVATAGQTINVKPGSYNGNLGESFPINVPAGVTLVGDEANRGAVAGGPSTTVGGTVSVGAGAKVAGFVITSTVGVGLSMTAAGATARNNTLTGNTGSYPLFVNAPSSTVLLNTVTGNTSSYPRVETNGSGKFENNTFTNNAYGFVSFNVNSDLGGGAFGSIGNNILSCNSNADAWAGSVAYPLSGNKWDRVPLAASSTFHGLGQELYYASAASLTSAQVNAGLAPSPCTGCTGGGAPSQNFDGFMVGCPGAGSPSSIAFSTRGSLCASGCRACTAAEYVAHRSGTVPPTSYWTADDLAWYSGNTGACFVSTTSTGGGILAGCTGGSMLVCPNVGGCNVRQCGLNTNAPIEYFGGCSTNTGGFGAADGTLCCCF